MVAAAAAANNANKKRRLILTIYRSFQRFCNKLPAETPLDEFIPPIGGKVIDDVTVFRKVLKDEFRKQEASDGQQERIQKAMEGMRQLNELRDDIIAYSKRLQELQKKKQQQQESTATTAAGNNTYYDFDDTASAENELDWVQQQIDTVRWLPKIVAGDDSPSQPQNIMEVDDKVKLPLFPLQSPFFDRTVLSSGGSSVDKDSDDSNGMTPLPLLTPQASIPIPGMEIPLRIFEPRYRQLYSDLREKPARFRNLVVPFCHPLASGKFAQYGLVHLVTQLDEVADETSGKIQYLANHVVTKPVQILRILNPQVWSTQETYLQVQVRYLEDDDTTKYREADSVHLQSLEEYLETLDHPMESRSLTAYRGEGFWTLVSVWNSYFQQELVQLQLGVAIEAKLQAGRMGDHNVVQLDINNPTMASSDISPEIVNLVQKPHRKRLLQLMLNTTLLVPTLLGLDGEGKCNHMIRVIEREIRQQQQSS